MTCQSSGIPRPLVTWYRDGSVIVPGSRVFQADDGTLRIVGLGASEGGVYRCEASNAAGRTARKGNLTVQGKIFEFGWSNSVLGWHGCVTSHLWSSLV